MSMYKLTNSRRLTDNEQGFASIVIALTLIIVLALLTVGFAQLARREQQTALDKQLANQAYYAAESGINDAVQDINNGYITTANADATHCMNTASLNPLALTRNATVNAQASAVYSCLLVDLTPQSLVFDDTPPASGQNLAFSTTQPLTDLTIQWGSFDGKNSFPGGITLGSEFKTQATWGNAPPVLLFSVTSTGAPGTISRSNLVNNTFNVYLYPSSTGSNPTTVSIASPQGQVVPGSCDLSHSGTYPCSVKLTNMGGGTHYVLHYISYYDDANVYITGQTLGGTPVDFIGQAQIDVTGKAHNVLKRLRAVLDASGTNGSIGTAPLLPNQALNGQNICKRLQSAPGITDFINPVGTTVDSGTDPCNLNH